MAFVATHAFSATISPPPTTTSFSTSIYTALTPADQAMFSSLSSSTTPKRDNLAMFCFGKGSGKPADKSALDDIVRNRFCETAAKNPIDPNFLFAEKYSVDGGVVWMQLTNTNHDQSWSVTYQDCVNNMLAPVNFCNPETDQKQGGVAYDAVMHHGYTVDVNWSGNSDNVPSPSDFPTISISTKADAAKLRARSTGSPHALSSGTNTTDRRITTTLECFAGTGQSPTDTKEAFAINTLLQDHFCASAQGQSIPDGAQLNTFYPAVVTDVQAPRVYFAIRNEGRLEGLHVDPIACPKAFEEILQKCWFGRVGESGGEVVQEVECGGVLHFVIQEWVYV
ncbi:hypothetical protein KC327_g5505 [Hortaea werneckii]|nr:hypothetical protein KC350_g9277 [Hortaea werneckii]KAI6846157.1 hypothetical protein KC358_g3007 [Hortaea werneckii]KAI6942196.1 hypothetical protein KC341_g2406 [Hortaea werneckii]KAI6945663.1 hypothetical protein KC348_g3670 [Hortaea werneckii]KAI6979628.1 hypothetical protein KC321_g2236 [Hortaea werneckii]